MSGIAFSEESREGRQDPVRSPLGSLLDHLRRERLADAPAHHAEGSLAEPEEIEFDIGAATPLSPFGALLDQLRRRPPARRPTAPHSPGVRRPARADLEPELRLETRVVTRAAPPSSRRMSWLVPAAFVLHVVVVVSATVLNLLTTEELPHPASGIRAFLVEPVVAAPPPPPPPPAPDAAAVRRPADDRADPPTPAFTAPSVTPDRIVTDEHLELDVEAAGEVGGVEGGIPGGVVGGIVGGLPPTPPLPPAPIRLEKGVREPRKVKHVAPRYPEVAARANIRGAVVLECLVSPDGRVAQVKVVRTSNPLLDEAALEAVRQWVYERTLVDGVPVSVIFMVTVQFNLG